MNSNYYPVSVFTDAETKSLVEDPQLDHSTQVKRLGNLATMTMYCGCTMTILVALIQLWISVMGARDTRLEDLPRPDIFAGLSI